MLIHNCRVKIKLLSCHFASTFWLKFGIFSGRNAKKNVFSGEGEEVRRTEIISHSYFYGSSSLTNFVKKRTISVTHFSKHLSIFILPKIFSNCTILKKGRWWQVFFVTWVFRGSLLFLGFYLWFLIKFQGDIQRCMIKSQQPLSSSTATRFISQTSKQMTWFSIKVQLHMWLRFRFRFGV